MASKVSRYSAVSSMALMSLLLLSSVTGIQLVKTVSAASPENPQLVYQAPLAASDSTGASGTSCLTGNETLDWTEDTGPGSCGTSGWNYSPQTQITESTVSQLSTSYIFPIPSIWSSIPAWGPCDYVNGTASCRFPGLIYSTGIEGTQAPVISDQGTGYVATNGLSVYAFDLATGKLLSSDYPSMDWSLFASSAISPGYGPGHLHGVNLVDGIIWVPGFGCQLQGWNALTSQLVANLTGLCNNIPGNNRPGTGEGHYYPYGDAEIQVDVANNVILEYGGGSAEGTGGGRAFVEGCSLSDALNLNSTTGTYNNPADNCTATGGACTTSAGGVCSSGSSLLWRTFLDPALDGSTPDFSSDICASGHVWIGGVPCLDLPASIIQNDWQNPSFNSTWKTTIGPSSGMSNNWGNFALNDPAGLFYMGTSQAAPDWNATYRPGPDLTADSVLGVSLTNGSIMWEDKVSAKDLNDQDCNLNLILANVNNQQMILKACKDGVVTGINALSGQPDWILDTTMPDYQTLGQSGGTTMFSQPFDCTPGNVTSCNYGAEWDKIYAAYDSNTLNMVGTNPHPHGYVSASPYRGSVEINPLNSTEMDQFVCPIGTNAECQALAGVGTNLGCPEFSTSVTSTVPTCASLEAQKTGFIEARYLMESENAYNGQYFYVVVMDGPMEHDFISDVQYQGTSGLTFDTDLYFAGTMTTNATVLALNPATGHVVWNYTRPIYYRGGLLATGGMVITQWPDGHLIFLDATTGAVVRDMNFGLPLLAPMSIAPDGSGTMHLLLTYGGTQHAVLGEVGLHGPLGHGYIVPGAVISLTVGPTVTTTGTSGTTPPPTEAVGTFNDAFYALVGVVVILAVIAGSMLITRKRVGPGVAPT